MAWTRVDASMRRLYRHSVVAVEKGGGKLPDSQILGEDRDVFFAADGGGGGRLPARPHSRLNHVFENACDRSPGDVALEYGSGRWTYRELDGRANQLAHYLREHGIELGDRVAILLDRSVHTYVALLAVGKAGAAFVPIDPESPQDRIDYITSDADVDLVLTTASFEDVLSASGKVRLELDTEADVLSTYPVSRPGLPATREDPAAYVIYTSGSTGRPKGVEVAQSSICNFLNVVPEVYDVRPGDRVYQGMTISFDFSIEEIWPTWAKGATLVAGPTDSGRLGDGLADFLEHAEITVLYCVPTLLATIPRDLPLLRSILVGGEACPGELVDRWARPGRRILNTYGPTEATVTATWCELLPGQLVTIGVPLPTYTIEILDDAQLSVPDGEVGEICIGGPGVARGYVGRPDLTAEKFFNHPAAPVGSKLYRTGDLGRITEEGEIEYLGRADSEVKIRGHRVDLGEIESVFLEDVDVASAVVAMASVNGADGLAAYAVLRSGTARSSDDELAMRLAEDLRHRLPAYMVPTFFDVVGSLPTMASGKVDRKRLPEPTGRRLKSATGPVVAPRGELERTMRDLWAEVIGFEADELSVEADFFNDLGGHSLAAAQLVSLLRENGIDQSVGLRDVYVNPTVRTLAAVLGAPARAVEQVEVNRHSGVRVARAGTVQGAFLVGLLLVVTLPVSVVYSRYGGQPSFALLVELLIATTIAFLGLRWLLPLALVRPLSAGIKPGRYRLWGKTYLRLWLVDQLLMLSPLPLLSGSPMMSPFLRALGAKVGRNSHLGTSTISLPTMLRLGDDVSVGYNTDLRGWRVEGGWVTVAHIEVADRGFVGANSVLEAGARIEADAMIAAQSVVGRDDTVPTGARWAGSPAQSVAALDPDVEEMAALPAAGKWTPRLAVGGTAGLILLELAAIATIVPSLVLVWAVLLRWGMIAALLATLAAGPVYVLSVSAVVAAGKRLVLPNLPTGVHDSRSGLGIRKWMADSLLEMSLTYTNSLYATLYTTGWLRLLGAKIGRGAEVSTVAHIDPDLLTIGPDSFVADMATIGGSTFCRGRMMFARTEVGERAFVGNAATVPAGSRTGVGSLVGVLTTPPAEGVPDGSSWLGSPAIFLPNRQDSGSYDDAFTYRPERRVIAHRLAIEFFRITLPATVIGVGLYAYLLGLSQVARTSSMAATIIAGPLLALATAIGVVLYVSAVKRNIIGTYVPRVEPLWASYVRRTEFVTGLYEAAAVPVLLNQLMGTPFLASALRNFGVEVGKRTFIGTTYLTEFDLVRIGDDAAIGTGVSLQTHLFEDRVMKMSHVSIEPGASIGPRSIVLYDAAVGEQAQLGPLSLVMKGERLPAGTRWQGIPAQAVRA